MSRNVTTKCEVCGLVPPRYGLGFPARPGVIPGLPEYLRDACLWVCGHPACDRSAKARALAAAKSAGITLHQIWRVHVFGAHPKEERSA